METRRIVIDARMLGWSGIGRYTAELLKHLQAADHDNTYLVLLNNRAFSGWRPVNRNFSKVRADFRPYGLGEQLRLPRLLKSLKPDIVHFLGFNSPWLYRGRRITTIHDLTLVDYFPGRGLSRLKYWPMRAVVRRAIKASMRLIVPSEFVKQQLVERYRVAGEKITVAYEAAELSSGRAQPVAGLKNQQFILYVGNAYPHKNLSRLLAGFGALAQEFEELKLVLCGRDNFFYQQLKAQLDRSLADRVVFLHGADDARLRWLYKHAQLFVFPSLSEGFGLPGLEAMSQGLAVAAAKASCLPEIYGPAAGYFDPHDPEDLARVVGKLLSDDEARRQLAYRGQQRAADFSWQKTAKKTVAVYQAGSGGSVKG